MEVFIRIINGLLAVFLFFLDIALGELLVTIGLGYLPMESVLAFITDITTFEFSNFSNSFVSVTPNELPVHPENSLKISCSIPK